MRGIHVVVALLAGLIIFGCGGGGGVPATSSLMYETTWRGVNASQRVTLFAPDGSQVRSLVLNKSAATNSLTFSDLAQGDYRLYAEMYSQADLGGVQTGELSTWRSVAGAATYRTEGDTTVSTVAVTPTSKAVTAPGTFPFAIAGANAAGTPTFLAPGSVVWSVLGGIGSISPSGNFQASTAGSGSVRASHTPSGKTGASAVTVTKPAPTRTKWTILVFMNAANDLYPYSKLNMNQMERVADNADVRFIVQWKQSQAKFSGSSFDGTRRYEVKPDVSGNIASRLVEDLGSTVDMGSPTALKDFLTWGLENYPADRVGVIVWNHGNGWRRRPAKGEPVYEPRAVSYDTETGNSIQIWDLASAFTDRHFDFIAWDCSLMQMAEVAYEIRNNATYVIGSQESPPPEGYPYDAIFSPFRDNPNTATRTLTKSFVDGMLAVPGYANEKITQSVLETSKLGALSTALDGLAGQLITHNGTLTTLAPDIRANAQSFSPSVSPPRYFFDLGDVLARLKAGSNVAAIDTAVDAVETARKAAIVWEGHNTKSPGSTGIAIDFTPGNVFTSSASDYSRLKFGQVTKWDEWLQVAP